MATFGKGQSYKGQRVHVSSVFDQVGAGRSGKNVAFSISNDERGPEDVITNPMLSYGTYQDKEGKTKDTYTVGYSNAQWKEIEAAANKDGDAMVLEADLFPRKNGPGLMVNTKTLKTPEKPFDAAAHKANLTAARDAKKAAKADKETAPEQEKEHAMEAE